MEVGAAVKGQERGQACIEGGQWACQTGWGIQRSARWQDTGRETSRQGAVRGAEARHKCNGAMPSSRMGEPYPARTEPANTAACPTRRLPQLVSHRSQRQGGVAAHAAAGVGGW
jgi:hypothetical protein